MIESRSGVIESAAVASTPVDSCRLSQAVRRCHLTPFTWQMPLFISHCEARLVSMDISPTDCINDIFKNNVNAMSQVA